ncbi:MAG: DUF58 domain-containing protein [Pseudomonadota bacterium]
MRWRFPDWRKPFRKLRRAGDSRLSRWVKRRQGDDQLPLTLRSKRIYILPTSVGVTFGIVCLAMLLGSMNYNNSMGFALTFLLVAIGLVAMHRCHQNLSGLKVVSASANPVFAGETAEIQVRLENDGRSERLDIEAYVGAAFSEASDVPAAGTAKVTIPLSTERRGFAIVERVGLRTQFPMNLLNTWTWMYLSTRCVVWPRPAVDAPARPDTPSPSGNKGGSRGDDDLVGLRDYQDGDSPRLIAWKTLARSDQLKSRQMSGGGTSTTWLEFDFTPPGDLEYRLSVLARWIIDAERADENFGLRLPDQEIPPNHGLQHRDRCLDALAAVPPGEEYRLA